MIKRLGVVFDCQYVLCQCVRSVLDVGVSTAYVYDYICMYGDN